MTSAHDHAGHTSQDHDAYSGHDEELLISLEGEG